MTHEFVKELLNVALQNEATIESVETIFVKEDNNPGIFEHLTKDEECKTGVPTNVFSTGATTSP